MPALVTAAASWGSRGCKEIECAAGCPTEAVLALVVSVRRELRAPVLRAGGW